MFNTDHRISLSEFNELFHLVVYVDAFRDIPRGEDPTLFGWASIPQNVKPIPVGLGDIESMTLEKLKPPIYATLTSLTYNV